MRAGCTALITMVSPRAEVLARLLEHVHRARLAVMGARDDLRHRVLGGLVSGHDALRPRYRATVAPTDTYVSQHPRSPQPHSGPSMSSGTWPNSPAPLRAPRTSWPSSAMPTPTPSDAFTNTTGPSAAVLRTAQSWASIDALTLFSTTTGSPVASCKRIAERDVLPAERRRAQQPSPLGVHEARNRDADAQALADDLLVGEQLR